VVARILIGLEHGAVESGSASRWVPVYAVAAVPGGGKKIENKERERERIVLPSVDLAPPVSTGPESSSVSDLAHNGSVTGIELAFQLFWGGGYSCRIAQRRCSVSW
jgi:hypothetical protein